ncbi:MAG: ribosome biogenesis GTPase Der [Gemmataceae bacterium]
MPAPLVTIVGRPNVGKSSLFNWLAGRRIAIVDPTAGVTRDRVSTLIDVGDRTVELFDTGGMGIEDSDNLTAQVEQQIQVGIDQADVILFVADARAGLVSLDEEVAQRLRSVNKPIILVANKCDAPTLDPDAAEFFRLGFGRLLCVSAQQNRGKPELLREIRDRLPPPDRQPEKPQEVSLKLAIVGRRNTGKSTFINCLAEADRVIVSEVAGTTRDSIDVRFERDGKVYLAIDTAGVRRKKSLANDIEFYSLHRAERSIRRADVVLLFLDAAEPVSKVDKQLAEYILDQHKPAIFVVNKWDLLKAKTPTGPMADYLHATFPSLDHVPIAFITAKSGKNVQAVLNLAQSLHKQATARVTTGDLNRVLRKAVLSNPPPMRQNRRARIYYATQVEVSPPTIVLFTNGPELLDNSYLRYLLNTFRDELPFKEVAIKLEVRSRTHLQERMVEDDETASPVPAERPEKKSRKPGPGGKKEPGLWQDV